VCACLPSYGFFLQTNCFSCRTLEELAKEQKKSASHLKQEIKESGKEGEIDESVVEQQEASAAKFLEFMEKARNGEMIPNDIIVRYAHYFKDDLTLDNMPRMQLINMCKCAKALLSSVICCNFLHLTVLPHNTTLNRQVYGYSTLRWRQFLKISATPSNANVAGG
jgi:LETM1-like protein